VNKGRLSIVQHVNSLLKLHETVSYFEVGERPLGRTAEGYKQRENYGGSERQFKIHNLTRMSWKKGNNFVIRISRLRSIVLLIRVIWK
jgi:hypothetical protein